MHVIKYTNAHNSKRRITFRVDQIKEVFEFIGILNKQRINYTHTFEEEL